MKKIVIFLAVAVLMGCTCIGQLQTQYVYADENCQAQLPDYLQIVSVSDNCSEVSLIQSPPAFAYISVHTEVTITATDQSGNINSSSFQVMLLDTIPPALYFTDTIAYNIEEITHVWKTWEAWIKQDLQLWVDEFNWGEFNIDTIRCYTNVICLD